MSINTSVLMGRLTFEPELKATPSGASVLRFQLAVERNYVPSGEQRQADFVDCVAWSKTAEFIKKYFHKGDMIAVDGSLQTNNFKDKNGNERKQVEVRVDNASFCGSKSSTKPNIDVNNAEIEEIETDTDDDMPF